MGKIANDLAKKHNLKDAAGFKAAMDELNGTFDKQIIPSVNTTPPMIDFSRKSKTTNGNNEAELMYPTSEKLDGTFVRTYLVPEFSTHPQIAGLINATATGRGSLLVVTTPLSEAPRIEQKEQTFLPNVLEVAWRKYVMAIERSINEANSKNEAERSAEVKALEFLKS